MTPSFRPIDAAAKTGAYHLLKDHRGHRHCGRWNHARGAFTYSSGKPIPGTIRAYFTRNPQPQRLTEGAA